ncbi:hypothetical protein BJX62DRAFT_220178 [Aspergillus germanicus]
MRSHRRMSFRALKQILSRPLRSPWHPRLLSTMSFRRLWLVRRQNILSHGSAASSGTWISPLRITSLATSTRRSSYQNRFLTCLKTAVLTPSPGQLRTRH